MATLSFTSPSLTPSFPPTNTKTRPTHYHFSFTSRKKHLPITFSMHDDQSSTVVASEKPSSDTGGSHKNGEEGEKREDDDEEEKQEVDWKTDEEFKRFMGNPSIEAAIKLEKKRADRRLKELDRENSDNPIMRLLNKALKDSLTREKERLEKAEETFKAIDLNKLKSCFGFDSFFPTDVRRFGDGGIFVGNLRRPIEEVMPTLEKKLSEAAGREVVVGI